MKMTVILGSNQVLSHGFGVFLFAALFPFMRDTLGLTHWHLAAVGIATQAAYLSGALSVGFLGRYFTPEKLILMAGGGSSLLLLSLSFTSSPLLLIPVLSLLAFSAAVCWSGIVGLISQHVAEDRAALSLAAAGSGTAWGYGINGLILIWWVPIWGWQSAWVMVAGVGAAVVLVTIQMMRSLPAHASPCQNYKLAESETAVLSTRQLFRAFLTERRAFLSCLIYFLIGLCCITFSSWLNAYLDELGQSETLAGPTWTMLGVSGMVAGITAGWLADRKGHVTALLIMSLGFAFGLAAFSYDPVEYALVVGAGYGLMYFPVWGIVSSWVAQRYSPIATMQLSGLGMVASALGGSAGNLAAGYIQNLTGSLSFLYLVLAVAGAAMVCVTGFMAWQQQRGADALGLCRS
ncbi:MFS transporter [Pontibacterium granulatum]|uniref:MFS transporter n=1 Tax=Pontibacterium granulatum TaxID=2036029 RepID=UPI00249BD36E|nr:MFS transporter [Pontibacterium granulatum]MDI3325553.1 MFS transporter [Pontibacterium granulatum]